MPNRPIGPSHTARSSTSAPSGVSPTTATVRPTPSGAITTSVSGAAPAASHSTMVVMVSSGIFAASGSTSTSSSWPTMATRSVCGSARRSFARRSPLRPVRVEHQHAARQWSVSVGDGERRHVGDGFFVVDQTRCLDRSIICGLCSERKRPQCALFSEKRPSRGAGIPQDEIIEHGGPDPNVSARSVAPIRIPTALIRFAPSPCTSSMAHRMLLSQASTRSGSFC